LRVETARALVGSYPLRLVCRLLDVGRSSVLYRRSAPRDLEGVKWVILHNRVTFPTMGFRLMYKLLMRQRLLCTRSEVHRAYRELNILGKRAAPRVRTTNSEHGEPRYPNLVKDLAIVRPDQVWVADTTDLKIGTRVAFLALVEDAFTRRVLGWAMGFSNNSLLVLDALEMALTRGRPEIHHSDQGKPYASMRHTGRLLKLAVKLSMAAVGCAWENGLVERLNRTFKHEEILRSEYTTLAQARAAIAKFVKLYNERRIHMSLGYRTPNEVNQAYGRDQTPDRQAPPDPSAQVDETHDRDQESGDQTQ
jgi:putative transposase